MTNMISQKATALTGPIRLPDGKPVTLPGDKSISHRALIMAALATGESRIIGLLEGGDVLNTARAMTALGADIARMDNGNWTVRGVGIGGLSAPDTPLDMGNSGTGARLIMGLVASYPFQTKFIGDKSLSCRPMKRVSEPLEKFGATFSQETLPLTVTGSRDPRPMEYEVPVASAQVKSAILLAALNIPGKTTVIEPTATRDHTERMFDYFGIEIATDGRRITVTGQPEIKARNMSIPADPSSAAFPAVAALITPGSDIILGNVGLNPARIGLYTTLREMGADITFTNQRQECGEPIADIHVRYSALRGITVPTGRAPSMIDEYPVLCIAAAFAEGNTVMRGLSELRVKESDRIAVMAAGLRACGVSVNEHDDGMTVSGSRQISGGGVVTTHLDHRIAMSFLTLGMATEKPVEIDDGSVMETSFPGFVNLMNGLGANIMGANIIGTHIRGTK